MVAKYHDLILGFIAIVIAHDGRTNCAGCVLFGGSGVPKRTAIIIANILWFDVWPDESPYSQLHLILQAVCVCVYVLLHVYLKLMFAYRFIKFHFINASVDTCYIVCYYIVYSFFFTFFAIHFIDLLQKIGGKSSGIVAFEIPHITTIKRYVKKLCAHDIRRMK